MSTKQTHSEGMGKILNPSGILWQRSINLMAKDYIGHNQSASQPDSQPKKQEKHFTIKKLTSKS